MNMAGLESEKVVELPCETYAAVICRVHRPSTVEWAMPRLTHSAATIQASQVSIVALLPRLCLSSGWRFPQAPRRCVKVRGAHQLLDRHLASNCMSNQQTVMHQLPSKKANSNNKENASQTIIVHDHSQHACRSNLDLDMPIAAYRPTPLDTIKSACGSNCTIVCRNDSKSCWGW